MTVLLAQVLLLVQLPAFIYNWDVEYVGQRIVVPRARLTQELLYCVCAQCQDERLDQLLQWTQQATLSPQTLLSSDRLDAANFHLRHDNRKQNMFTLVLARNADDSAFELQDRVLRGRHFYLNFVVLVEPIEDFAIVVRVLRRMQRRRFISADVYYRNATTRRNEIFGYANYPRFAPENKTEFVGDLSRFYAQLLHVFNAHGYAFATPILQDAPNVIKYVNGASGQLHIRGTSYGILKMFVEYINGTLIEYGRSIDEAVDMSRVLNMVRAGEIEVAAHAYALFESDARVAKSYPLSVVNWCLMVPMDYSVSTMYYPLLPYEPPVWIAAVCTFIVFYVVNGRWLRRCGSKAPNCFLLYSFCQFVNITPPRAMRVGPFLNMFFQACVFVHSFFLWALYAAMLGSFLTVTIVHGQINSIADLVVLQLPVLIINYELEFLLLSNDERPNLPQAFRALLRPVSYATFHRHQFAWNTSFAYFVTDDKWHFLDLQQRFFRRRIFKLSDICFGSYHQAFPMAPDSLLWRDLEQFLYRVHSSGLHFYHESKAFDYAVWSGILQRLKDAHFRAFESVGLQHLRVVFYLHGSILLLGFVCFLVERFGHIHCSS